MTAPDRDLPGGRPRGRLALIPADQRAGLGGIVIGVANAGRPVKVGVDLVGMRQHMHILGPTGTGKSSLQVRMILEDAEHGRGIVVFDPKGDLVRDVLDRLPATCGDRLVIIDPDEQDAPPALNLLQPGVGGGSPHEVAAHVTSVMAKVWSRWWGHRTADLAHHGLLTLAHLPGSTLADLPRLLVDRPWRIRVVSTVAAALGSLAARPLVDFWLGFDGFPAGHRAALTAPLLAKLRLVLAHPLAAGLFGVPASTFRLDDVLNGGILLCRLPKGSIGEDGTRLIGSLLLAGLWQATTARAQIPENDRVNCRIVIDECQNFLHLPIGIDDALAEARGLRTSFVLAHQYLGQLSDDMADAIDANARNKVYFALAPKDAADQARHVHPYLSDGDLIRLGAYEIVLRPIAGGRALAPVTAETLPAPPTAAGGRADLLRAAARRNTGLPQKARTAMLARSVTADELSEADGDETGRVPDLVGDNPFASPVQPARSNESSSAWSNGSGVDHEHADQYAPFDTVFGQLSGGEENPWTGTD